MSATTTFNKRGVRRACVVAMSSPVRQHETTANVNECDDVTQGHRTAKVKVKLNVKDDDEDSDKTATLGRYQSPWSRDTVFTSRRPQRR